MNGIMDKDILGFVTFCIGAVAQSQKQSRNEVYGKLKRSGILYDYIVPCYDVLHTFSSQYIVDDITDYMRKKGVLCDYDGERKIEADNT